MQVDSSWCGVLCVTAPLLMVLGCSASSEPARPSEVESTPQGAAGSTGAITSGTGGSGTLILPEEEGGSGSVPTSAEIIETLPEGFTEVDKGGFRIVSLLADAAVPSDDGSVCGNVIRGVVRDFSQTHEDFETYCCWNETGALSGLLGAGRKPVWAGNAPQQWTGEELFNQWYNYVEEVNVPYLIELWLEPQPGGLFTFEALTDGFFPLDGLGFGNEDQWRNFHFTTEIHTSFYYNGGEIFTFTGDDDLWVYMNDQLIIDLGGVHDEMSQEIVLDDIASTIGMAIGNTYNLDLFHAERHTSESNFRIDSSLSLADCGTIVDDVLY